MTAQNNGIQETIKDEIHFFSETIIDEHPELAMEVLGFAAKFGIALGWHYLLDLTWVLSKLQSLPPLCILDAGAGGGLLQFILATHGHKIISADAFIRNPPKSVENIIPVYKSGSKEAIKTSYAVYHNQAQGMEELSLPSRERVPFGSIEYHCCNLENMEHLETNEVDVVVSISALEHNPPEKIPTIMQELQRASKPGAPMLITISMDNPPRFDEPSYSWLLNHKGVARLYGLAADYETNSEDMGRMLEDLKQAQRLPRWLASMYFASGKNGCPGAFGTRHIALLECLFPIKSTVEII